MTDGVGALLSPHAGMAAAGLWRPQRGTNLLDTGAPFYDVYRTSDDRYVAVGALEDEFFAALIAGLDIAPGEVTDRWNPRTWPSLRQRLSTAFAAKTRAEWTEIFAETDGCVAPVLSFAEAAEDGPNAARDAFDRGAGWPQPASAPRFDRTPGGPVASPTTSITPIETIVEEWSREPV
jgi:alpha-methylacyl-CoA racemase